MVHVSDPSRLRQEPEGSTKGKQAAAAVPPLLVKLEIEDPVEEECGPLAKRSKPSGSFQQEFQQQWRADASAVPSQHAHYNPLNEPSPLGLRLRKSPSLLELIQMKLSQANAATSCISESEHPETGKRKDAKSTGASGTTDKLKASNFPASLLRIGTWECISRYEGDLVAKCYFAKHKLVWEVLDGGLKSKIEIQWSDITALKASCAENKPGTLDIVLARQPLFFKETNPQPRKHTLWQATSDFTGGQASIHRKHFLQCAPGLLSKHFEKLIQCDPRLYSLCQQPDIILDSPYFEPRCSVFEDQEETKCPIFSHVGDYGSSFSGFRDVASTCSASPTSSRSDARDPTGSGRIQDSASRETPSPSSVIDTRTIEEHTNCEAEEIKDPSRWDQFKVPGLHPSMSMSDLVNHIGNCISGQKTSGNPLFSDATFSDKENKNMLDEITQILLSDSQISAASDENSLMSRVNSLCCLLQKDPASVQSLQMNKEADNVSDDKDQILERKPIFDSSVVGGGSDVSPHKPSAISRKESVGDLLLNLPRIASLPQFLFNISEDKEYKAR